VRAKRVAGALNAEAAPAPRPRRAGRPQGWAPSSVREVLFRELYRGVIVWNQTQKIVRRGAKGQRRRPTGEVLRVNLPALRIVPEELWRAVHDRLETERGLYKPRGPRPGGRPVNGLDSPYLLTGLGACAACGGSMAILKRAHGPRGKRRQVAFYGCMTSHLRGAAICANTLEVPLLDTDQAVLTAIEHDLLRVEVLETSLVKALEALQGPGEQAQRAATLHDEQARLEAEVARLAAAIAAGGDLPALVTLLSERERRRGQVQAELVAVERETQRSQPIEELLDQLREHLAHWRATLHQETGPARQALRALLAGRLAFTAVEENGRRGYRFEGPGTLDKAIEGVVSVQQNGWWPQRDSNPCFSLERAVS
jgi:site-specific DNA recombinase